VDGSYTRNPAGEVTYQPRTQEELDRIAALVRSSIGFDGKRGDQIEVVNLRFAEAPPVAEAATPTGFMALLTPTRDDIMRGLEMTVLFFMVLIVTLVVVRPLVRTIMAPLAPQLQLAEAGQGAGARAGLPAPGQPSQLAIPAFEETEAGRMLDIARVQGQVQARSVERIGEIVKENPAGTATILRQWINEERPS